MNPTMGMLGARRVLGLGACVAVCGLLTIKSAARGAPGCFSLAPHSVLHWSAVDDDLASGSPNRRFNCPLTASDRHLAKVFCAFAAGHGTCVNMPRHASGGLLARILSTQNRRATISPHVTMANTRSGNLRWWCSVGGGGGGGGGWGGWFLCV